MSQVNSKPADYPVQFSTPYKCNGCNVVTYRAVHPAVKTPDQGSTSSGQDSFTYFSDYFGDPYDYDDSEYISHDDYSGEYFSDTVVPALKTLILSQLPAATDSRSTARVLTDNLFVEKASGLTDAEVRQAVKTWLSVEDDPEVLEEEIAMELQAVDEQLAGVTLDDDVPSEEEDDDGGLDDLAYHLSYLYDDTSYASSSTSPSFTGGFHKDTIGGHGTSTAGSAAGAISSQSSLEEEACYGDELPACAGGCISASDVEAMLDDSTFDLDVFCPMYTCDGNTDIPSSECLSDDPVENLHQHGGAAPGAQISVFDVSYVGTEVYASWAGNDLWYSAMETGAKIHTNSWGGATLCQLTEKEYMYDMFMYENPEHLLIFSAGNDGGYEDIPNREACTVGSPALGKNSLAVGATSSGPFPGTRTGDDGNLFYEEVGLTDYSPEGYPWICLMPYLGTPSASTEPAGVDTVAYFSSQGPTLDGRIKPDVVAPGDQVASASSDGTDEHSCKLAGPPLPAPWLPVPLPW
ncbi:unnamed protein product [Ectocarpus sp. CCAP 1310/34]|nr:unnamed protein product [Ectocarpus sp. CCAP 1310/34]